MLVSVDALVIDYWHEVSMAALFQIGGIEDATIPQPTNFDSAIAEVALGGGSPTLGGITMNALLMAKWMCSDVTARFVGFAGADHAALLELTAKPPGIDLVLHADVSCPTQQVKFNVTRRLRLLAIYFFIHFY